MATTYQEKMAALAHKRMTIDEEIRQKKLALKHAEDKIKEDIFNELTAVLKAQNPFELDLETFLGGVLFVVSEMKSETSTLISSWQQKGAQELKRFQHRRRAKAKAIDASEMDQKVA